jgi:FixJ family two-component response regulator
MERLAIACIVATSRWLPEPGFVPSARILDDPEFRHHRSAPMPHSASEGAPDAARAGWIAVVDDDPSVCRALERLLRAHGWRARTFRSGEDSLAGRGSDAPRCLLLDIQLEGMTGRELRDVLRSRGDREPVVLMTAFRDETDAQVRGEDILRKPFETVDLLERIRDAVARG